MEVEGCRRMNVEINLQNIRPGVVVRFNRRKFGGGGVQG